MKKPLLIFAIKCSVILYFAACTGINEYTSTVSATPQITKGTWKVKLFTDAGNDRTETFEHYVLTFDPTGKIVALNGSEKVTGNWAEDDISKRITINLDTHDAVLVRLNSSWEISMIGDDGLSFKNTQNPSKDKFQIKSL